MVGTKAALALPNPQTRNGSDSMLCPRCPGENLRTVRYEGVAVDTCDSCGGEFLDHDELGHIVQVREARIPQRVRSMVEGREPVHGVAVEHRDHKTTCPKCATTMQVLNYCGDSGVLIDRCPGCGGFWVDTDELEMIQAFQEDWEARAPRAIQEVAAQLEAARRENALGLNRVFQGSRFAFINALINRFLDAA